MSAVIAEKTATYDDLPAVPEHLVAQMIDGELITRSHPPCTNAFNSTMDDDAVSAPPFDVISFDLSMLWADA